MIKGDIVIIIIFIWLISIWKDILIIISLNGNGIIVIYYFKFIVI